MLIAALLEEQPTFTPYKTHAVTYHINFSLRQHLQQNASNSYQQLEHENKAHKKC
jgi:hypothetical protein